MFFAAFFWGTGEIGRAAYFEKLPFVIFAIVFANAASCTGVIWRRRRALSIYR